MNVITWPNKVLSIKAQEVTEFNDEIKQLVADMKITMRASGGIGLAAPQVDISKRVIVVSRSFRESTAMINPRYTGIGNKINSREGCLSIPGRMFTVQRYPAVLVSYQTTEGQQKSERCHFMLAKCIQHEIDHLDGITIADIGR